jgi:transposase-like protein
MQKKDTVRAVVWLPNIAALSDNARPSEEKEVLELKKKLREVEMERDILKKAALIFGRGS